MQRLARLAILCVLASASPATAQDLFHPTPDDRMRELTTDRPHTTEAAMTVDAGHVQVEMDVMRYQIDGGTTDLAMAAMLWKVGLTSTLDLQLGFEPLRATDRHRADGAPDLTSGWGDTIVRVKWTMFSIPERFAIGLLPFVSHVSASGAFAPGVALLFGLPLARLSELEWMLEVVSHPREQASSETVLLATAAVTHPVVGDLVVFVEAEGTARRGDAWSGAFRANGGFVLPIHDEVQLDLGVRVPIVGAVPLELFLGLSARR